MISYKPNPTANHLYFSLNDKQLPEQEFEVQIFNMAGQLVKSEPFSAGTYSGELNINGISNGYYLIQFTNALGASFHQKIIINK